MSLGLPEACQYFCSFPSPPKKKAKEGHSRVTHPEILVFELIPLMLKTELLILSLSLYCFPLPSCLFFFQPCRGVSGLIAKLNGGKCTIPHRYQTG